MYEAYLYLSGGSVDYGINSRKNPGLRRAPEHLRARARPRPTPAIYQSPLTISCQKNFIVLLTDGLPTADNSREHGDPGADRRAPARAPATAAASRKSPSYMYERTTCGRR